VSHSINVVGIAVSRRATLVRISPAALAAVDTA
jgi:hypothetical protein